MALQGIQHQVPALAAEAVLVLDLEGDLPAMENPARAMAAVVLDPIMEATAASQPADSANLACRQATAVVVSVNCLRSFSSTKLLMHGQQDW